MWIVKINNRRHSRHCSVDRAESVWRKLRRNGHDAWISYVPPYPRCISAGREFLP